jgi:hypothetical protein
MYTGKGGWKNTIWPETKLRPYMKIRSAYIYAVYQTREYDGRGAVNIFAGKHIKWHSTPDWVMKTLAENSDLRVAMFDSNGQLSGSRTQTRLESLMSIVFKGVGELSELVGIRFSFKEAPKRYTNPRKRRKKKK